MSVVYSSFIPLPWIENYGILTLDTLLNVLSSVEEHAFCASFAPTGLW
jgi:hypothetical protein